MMKKIFITRSPKETWRLGKLLAETFAREYGKHALVFALKGDLGGGKTSFAAGFAKGLGVKGRVASPTFVILKKYDLAKKKEQDGKHERFFHIDGYRIRNGKEMIDLGFDKIRENPANIILIEWAEIIKEILPRDAIWLDFEFLDARSRRITLNCSRRFFLPSPASC
jgi:tRNA threonylcarbamoyladenosine biosynthesis protein TsaE